jgi:hypothetical protein
MTDIPLFDLPEGEPKLKRVAPTSDKPTWRQRKGKTRYVCDDCMILVHREEQRFPRVAVHIRTIGGNDRYLCTEHAQHWRDLDRKDTG